MSGIGILPEIVAAALKRNTVPAGPPAEGVGPLDVASQPMSKVNPPTPSLDEVGIASTHPYQDPATGLSPGESGPPAPPPAISKAAVPPPSPDVPPEVGGIIGGIPGVTPPLKPTNPADVENSVIGGMQPTGPLPKLGKQPLTTGQKIGAVVSSLGALGGGLEAAGTPLHQAPNAARLLSAQEAAAQRQIESEKLQKVEIPKAQAYSDYMSGRNETAENVAGTRANATVTASENRADAARDVATINANSRNQIAALQAGAGMLITPEMAKIAGQPAYSNMYLSGKSLGNFMKVFNGAGAAIHDLGEDGLWAVDRMGNKIKQVSVSSPAMARGASYARAKAENTPTNVMRIDENGRPYVAGISQAEQLRTGEPTAQVEAGIQGPTSQSKNMAQMAKTLLPHLDDLTSFVSANADLIGPINGRVVASFLGGTIGSTGDPMLDEKLGTLRGDYTLFKSALARTHFAGRAGPQAAEYFEKLLSNATSAHGVLGVLASTRPYIQTYSEMGDFTPERLGGQTGGGTPANKPKPAAAKPSGGTTRFTEGTDVWNIPADKVAAFKKAHPNARSK